MIRMIENINKNPKKINYKKVVCPECFGDLTLLVDCWASYEVTGKTISKTPTLIEFDHRFLECPECAIHGNVNDSCGFNLVLHNLLDKIEFFNRQGE